MTWVKLDDHFPDHPKVLAAGPLAAWLYVCGLAYASRYLTDGFVPAAQVPRLADLKQASALAERLVDAGLWEQTDGGYQIHDYLEYQRSAREVDELSAKRAEAGRRGGARSGEVRREANAKQVAGQTGSNVPSKNEAIASSKNEANAKQIQNTDTDTELLSPKGGGASFTSSRVPAPAGMDLPIPKNLELTDDDIAAAMNAGVAMAHVAEEWQHFTSYYGARQGERRTDWHAQWRTWLGMRSQFPKRTPANGAPTRREQRTPSSGVVSRGQGDEQKSMIGRD